eukprot:6434922-Pyramimonas_sp.AAC.1
MGKWNKRTENSGAKVKAKDSYAGAQGEGQSLASNANMEAHGDQNTEQELGGWISRHRLLRQLRALPTATLSHRP